MCFDSEIKSFAQLENAAEWLDRAIPGPFLAAGWTKTPLIFRTKCGPEGIKKACPLGAADKPR
jgi:hypothetical protein